MIESVSSYRFLEKKILNRKDFKAEVRCEADFKATVPNFFGIRDRFHGRQFFQSGGERGGKGWFQDDPSMLCSTVHFIITTSVPPHIIKH